MWLTGSPIGLAPQWLVGHKLYSLLVPGAISPGAHWMPQLMHDALVHFHADNDIDTLNLFASSPICDQNYPMANSIIHYD